MGNLSRSVVAEMINRFESPGFNPQSPTFAGAQAGEATSNQLNDPPLRVGMRFDVALGGRKRCMSSQ